MTEGTCSKEEGFYLLNEFEHVLESDPLIDEVGFVHPSQFILLDEEGGSNTHRNELQAKDGILKSFWIREHKLGISMQILLPLYKATKSAFMAALWEYKRHSNSNDESLSLQNLESEVAKHSRALLLLSSDFGSAWNARKLILSKNEQLSVFLDELRLCGLILSKTPKSEQTWSHRRWIIKMIARRFLTLQEILNKESELVEKIAERYKMNYRAWNHRCWLVSYMTTEQVLLELKASKNWARLHVADSSCFHYRRRLMFKILESCNGKEISTYDKAHEIWKEELDWSKELIERYVGREALWLHRRFLSLSWIKHFACHLSDDPSETEQGIIINEEVAIFMEKEIHLLESSTSIPDNKFEDFQAQAIHAGSYILWLTKQIPELWRMLKEKLGTDKLNGMLNSAFQGNPWLWDHLVQLEDSSFSNRLCL